MLNVTDLTGRSELLTDFSGLTRSRQVNSQRVIEFNIHPTPRNAHAIDLVENESVISVFDEEYVIKNCVTKAVGTSYIKSVTAIKKFYVDMLGKQQTRIHNGSMTFLAALDFVFENSGYTPIVSDGVFYAQSFENLGNTNRLSILQTIIERYGAEFVTEGTNVYFYAEVGERTDEIFRYGHNIQAFEMTYNTNNLATKISGTGANIGTEESSNFITATYTSPRQAQYGIIEAEPLNDERYTTTSALLTALQNKLIDEPELSVQLDVAILKQQGIEDLNEGDYIYLIYEPVNDLELYVRIVEINEYYDSNLNIIDSDITLANKPDTLTVNLADQIQHKVDEVKKEVATLVQQSANGKNKNFYSTIKPTGGSLNDIWYETVGTGEIKMHIHDGVEWIEKAYSADGLGGTLDAAQLNVINLNAASIAGGDLDLAKGISVKNGATEVLKVANRKVVMNVDTLTINAKSVEEEIIRLENSIVNNEGLFTWIKYANDASGNGMSNSPTGKNYIGIAYNKISQTPSNVASDYAWSLIRGEKGEQGEQGEPGLRGLQGETGERGIPGVKGADGVTRYTHIAYANNNTGTLDFSVGDPNRTHIGMYVDTNEIDSTDPTKYKWTLIKGANGANGTPGPAGTDGRTPFLHIAYATNATGTTGFSTTVSTGKTYIGTYTDFIEADSTNPALYSWTLIKGADGTNGTNAITAVLSNEAHTFPANNSGVISNYANASTNITIYNGTADESLYWTVTPTPSSGVTGNLFLKTYTVTGMTTDVGYVDFTISRSGYPSITKRFTLTKSKDGLNGGVNGVDATAYWMLTDYSAVARSTTNVFTPTSVVLTGKMQSGAQPVVNYSGRFTVETSTNGSTFTNVYTSSANQATYTYTLPTTNQATYKAFRFRFYAAGGTTILLDEQVIPVVSDGAKGDKGNDGTDGAPTYTWVKYADDANGAGMSDSPNGKKYLGMAYNKTTTVESTNPSDYTWSLLYDDAELGGRNLYLDSHLANFTSVNNTTSPITTTSFTANVFPYRRYAITNGASTPSISLYNDLKTVNFSNPDFLGRNVTISFRVRANKIVTAQFNPYYQINGIGSPFVFPTNYNQSTTVTTVWKTISFTYANFNGVLNSNTVFRTAPQVLTGGLVAGDYLEIGGYKIEFGTKNSDYTKAPEDLEITLTDQLREKVGEAEFNEFLDNYSGEIQVVTNKMAELEQTSNGFNFSITDIETIMAGLQTFTNTVRSYLDFTSEDMLMLGKSNSPFKVQITNSQLNFLNGSDILAYMNGSKLFITDAEITNTILIGNHIFQSGNNGTVIKWAGV